MKAQKTITWQGDDVDVDIEYSPGVYRPACTSGPPDNWHPDESDPPEITSIKVSDTGEEILSRLSDEEVDRLVDKLIDDAIDAEPDYDYDPCDDIGDDDWREAQDSWERSQGI